MQDFIKRKINVLKQNQRQVILFSLTYLIGIILGVFFLGDKSEGSILYTNANNYHIIIFSSDNSIISLFIKILLSGILLTIPVILLGLTIATIPFICIILFYRGIILGTAFILFYSISGISGIITFIILTLPMHVLLTAGLIVASVLNYGIKSSCNKSRVAEVIKNSLFSIAFTLISAIYFSFIMITVVRPINLIF